MSLPIEQELARLQAAIDDLRSSANAQSAFLMGQQQSADVLRRDAPLDAIPIFEQLQSQFDALRASFNSQAAILIGQQSSASKLKAALTPTSITRPVAGAGGSAFLLHGLERVEVFLAREVELRVQSFSILVAESESYRHT